MWEQHIYDKSFPHSPKPGDRAWDFRFELADGTFVHVHVGQEGHDAFRRMLYEEELDDALDTATSEIAG